MEYFERFVQQLKHLSTEVLPGWDAQSRMAPPHRATPDVTAEYYQKARKGGVLIAFYPHNEAVHTVMIQRPTYDGVHSGQVAFPGGKWEEGDVDIVQTALREAWEEVGILPEKVEVIRPLTELYIPPSNFLVTPILGVCYERPSFVAQPTEVEGILETDVRLLADPLIASIRHIQVRGDLTVESPSFDVNGRIVWGATAMMISELNVLMGKIKWVEE